METSTSNAAFTELNCVEWYHFNNTHCQLKVVRSDIYNKVYVGVHKYSSYVDQTTQEEKHTHSFVNLPLVAVDELIRRLSDVRNYAKQQQLRATPAPAAASVSTASQLNKPQGAIIFVIKLTCTILPCIFVHRSNCGEWRRPRRTHR